MDVAILILCIIPCLAWISFILVRGKKRERVAKIKAQEFKAKVAEFLEMNILWLPEGELYVKNEGQHVRREFTVDDTWNAAVSYLKAIDAGKLNRREFSSKADFVGFVLRKVNPRLFRKKVLVYYI